MAPSPDLRTAELARGVLALLAEAPDGLTASDLFDRMANSMPPSPAELPGPATPVGVRPYEDAIRRSTIALVRTGWLTRSDGVWRATEKGQRSLTRFLEPRDFYRVALSQRDWELTDGKPASDVGDLFAGCFLSMAGSLVGSTVGTLVLFARMLPDPSLALIPGFAAAFIVGVVVGLVARFPMASLALGLGRAVENIWLVGTALAAGAAAAVTPSLLIAVDTTR